MESNTDPQAPLVDPVVTDPVIPQTEPTEAEKELQAKLDAATLENKRIKGTMSAADKKLAALQKETEELKLSGMNEVEKEKELAKKEREIAMSQTKNSLAAKLELDETAADLLNSETGEEMVIKSELLTIYRDAVRKESADEISALKAEIESLKGNMENPGSGVSKGVPQMKYDQYEALTPKEQAAFMKKGGVLI